MFATLNKTWWLLALCGIVDAMCAVMHLLMLTPDGSVSLRRVGSLNVVWDISLLALLAGSCAVAAGLWNSGRGYSWLLSVHGLALAAFGLIGVSPLIRGPLSFRPVSLLFVLMAISIGAFAWRAGQTLFGVASMGYAISFVAVGFGWIRLGAPESYWIWMSSYFGFCAIFMFYLTLGMHTADVFPLRSARHAH